MADEPVQFPPQVLIIDDDRKLTGLLIEFLRANGLQAEAAYDGNEGLQRARSQPWDLVVLDVMMPHCDGHQVLARLRAEANPVPVLMLTARGDEDERIHGLEQGADDYLPKTASSRELLARVRALLRRVALNAPPAAQRELRVGGLAVNPAARLAWIDGQALELTPAEFDLLLDLISHRGQARSRETLSAVLRERPSAASNRAIDVHICALRRKLGDDPRTPRYIRTVRTIGYRLADPDEPLTTS
ncbi:MAG: response regulator transcription factor [Sinobacteraceae bacterium]|nr:response regulator transcription factor [Nevskiaceae bacterium]